MKQALPILVILFNYDCLTFFFLISIALLLLHHVQLWPIQIFFSFFVHLFFVMVVHLFFVPQIVVIFFTVHASGSNCLDSGEGCRKRWSYVPLQRQEGEFRIIMGSLYWLCHFFLIPVALQPLYHVQLCPIQFSSLLLCLPPFVTLFFNTHLSIFFCTGHLFFRDKEGKFRTTMNAHSKVVFATSLFNFYVCEAFNLL
jgi:hypothetical protein